VLSDTFGSIFSPIVNPRFGGQRRFSRLRGFPRLHGRVDPERAVPRRPAVASFVPTLEA
jgi:hypothetical protein